VAKKSKKKPKKKKTSSSKPLRNLAKPPINESVGVTNLTVAWMLCTLMGTVACLAMIVVWAVANFAFDVPEEAVAWQAFTVLLLLTATILGLLCAGLTAAVIRIRPEPPPKPIVFWSLGVAAAPFVWFFLMWIRE